MKAVVTILVLVSFAITAHATVSVDLERDILAWGQERREQLKKNDRTGQVAEWAKRTKNKEYEWMAVTLAVHNAVEKIMCLSIKGDKINTPKLDETIQKDKDRLVKLGRYIVRINGALAEY